MNRIFLATLFTSGLFLAQAEASYIVIDDFTQDSYINAAVGAGTSRQTIGTFAGVANATRDVVVTYQSGTGNATFAINDAPPPFGFAPPPSMSLSVGGDAKYSTVITYDNFGVVDLSASGALGFILTVVSTEQAQGVEFMMTVYSGPSSWTISVPKITSATDVYIPFASFVPANAFTSINKIEMKIMDTAGNYANDWKISNLRTGVVPEPTSLALAGFAGIGMAVGAIRRRRQAKQAA